MTSPNFLKLLKDSDLRPFSLIAASGGLRDDIVLSLELNGQTQLFVGEVKAPATPKAVELALLQLRRLRAEGPADVAPIIAAPYLSPAVLGRLQEVGVSGIDLSGNMFVVVPGRWYVLKQGAPNLYPTSRPISAVFQGVSSLVARTFLVRREFPLQKDVRAEIELRGGKISPGTVSKVMKVLEDELLVRRGSDGIRLLQPEALLERLEAAYQPPRSTRRVVGRTELTPAILAEMNRVSKLAGIDWAIGRTAGGDVPESPPLPIYVSSLDEPAMVLDLEETQRFADVELIETTDPAIYFDRRRQNETPYLSPIQRYLELASGGKRERELSRNLREAILEPR